MKPCLKREVCAVIIDQDGKIAVGQNLIQNDTVRKCPRVGNEGYEKCLSICNQVGHAETEAIKVAKKRNMKLNGAILYLTGHFYACYNCREACKKEGIKIIILGDNNE